MSDVIFTAGADQKCANNYLQENFTFCYSFGSLHTSDLNLVNFYTKVYSIMYAKGGIILVVLLIIQLQLSSSSYLKQLFALRTRKDARSFHGLVDSFSSRIEGTRTKRPENILNRKLVMLRGGFSLDSLNPGLSPSLHQSKILLQVTDQLPQLILSQIQRIFQLRNNLFLIDRADYV